MRANLLLVILLVFGIFGIFIERAGVKRVSAQDLLVIHVCESYGPDDPSATCGSNACPNPTSPRSVRF
jgi:hypothetical protein